MGIVVMVNANACLAGLDLIVDNVKLCDYELF
jgi:hypothetical protein